MNNSARTFSFIILSSMIMMAAIILQNMFFPQPPADLVEQQPNAAVQAENPEQDPQQPAAPAEEAAATDDQDDSPVAKQESTEPVTDPKLTADNAAPEVKPAAEKQENKLISIGSMDPASGYRFLVTLNSEGAAVRRVQLNERNRKGRIKYRDLEYKGGYIGELECVDANGGCQLQIVGAGTPAAIAGLESKDVINSLNGQPVTSAEDFLTMMENTKVGQKITIVASRNEQQVTAEVTLTNIPIELIRPEPPVLDPNYEYPESFLMTLRKPISGKDWPELDSRMKTANWKVREISDGQTPKIEFSYVLTDEILNQFEIPGPITVYKRYWLEKYDEQTIANPGTRSWDLRLEIEIESEADQSAEVAYELDGPTGTPTEGWWYQMKIHGRSSALGKIAGARDIIASSDGNSFEFYSATEIAKNSLKTLPKKHFLFSPFEDDPIYRKVNFVGVDTQYFTVALMPDPGSPYYCYSGLAWHTGGKIPNKVRLQKLVDVTPMMFTKISLGGEQSYTQKFEVFCGPKVPEILEVYGLESARTFGWFAWVSQGLCKLLQILYNLTFQYSYAIPIILLTIMVRSLMIPFSRRAALNAQMMQHLQPQIKEISEKYKEDMEKRAQAQRELFKRHNYNPFGGCFMGLFQLPIFLGLYRGLSVDIALRDQPLIPGVSWCSNLAAPDQLLNWQSWMPAMLSAESGWLGPYLNILPIITMFLFIAQQKLFMPPATDDQQKMMQKMMSFMMIFMGFLFFKVPSGLCLYFITSSVWGIIERIMLPKPVLDTSKLSLDSDEVESKPVQNVPKTETLSNEVELANRRRRDRERKKRLKERDR